MDENNEEKKYVNKVLGWSIVVLALTILAASLLIIYLKSVIGFGY